MNAKHTLSLFSRHLNTTGSTRGQGGRGGIKKIEYKLDK